MLTKDYPDHRDADLVLKLHERRREAVMCESRARLNADFWPATLDDVLAVTRTDHPLNAAFRQCVSYWEMASAMARHGGIHADFLLERTGEGLLLYVGVEPWLAEYRATVNPPGFRNAEGVVTQSEVGRRIAERFRARVRPAPPGRA